jgi:hypothetical protein
MRVFLLFQLPIGSKRIRERRLGIPGEIPSTIVAKFRGTILCFFNPGYEFESVLLIVAVHGRDPCLVPMDPKWVLDEFRDGACGRRKHVEFSDLSSADVVAGGGTGKKGFKSLCSNDKFLDIVSMLEEDAFSDHMINERVGGAVKGSDAPIFVVQLVGEGIIGGIKGTGRVDITLLSMVVNPFDGVVQASGKCDLNHFE